MFVAEDSFALSKPVERLKQLILHVESIESKEKEAMALLGSVVDESSNGSSSSSSTNIQSRIKKEGSKKEEKSESARKKRWRSALFYGLQIAWSLRTLLWAKPLLKTLMQLANDHRFKTLDSDQATCVAQWCQTLKGSNVRGFVKGAKKTSWDSASEFWRTAEVSRYGET